MGLFTTGRPLTWKELVSHIADIKLHGIAQFISIYNRFKDRDGDPLRWGDEVEYTLCRFEATQRQVYALLASERLLEALGDTPHEEAPGGGAIYEPEYTGWQIEMTPGRPYEDIEHALLEVERNMKWRRESVAALLASDESVMSISFPAIGSPKFTWPPLTPQPDDPASASKSIFVADAALNLNHPRYRVITQNIRERRGRKVIVNIPIFRDKNTPQPYIEKLSNVEDQKLALPDHIYLDTKAIGGGMNCCQVTIQAANMAEARWLYDQLLTITPLVVALSAATPIFRSYLADVDTRWPALTAAVDDRTRGESGEAPLAENELQLERPRYYYADAYLTPSSAHLNDLQRAHHPEHLKLLLAGGVDETLARHVAHLFARDPIQVFKERLEQDNDHDTEHFDTILTSVWESIRLKPPVADSQLGWRIEFRPMEVGLCDFENAAFCNFVVMLSRAILALKLDFRINISQVMENMKLVQNRDAVRTAKLQFAFNQQDSNQQHDACKRSINDIINGNDTDCPGLIPLIGLWLDNNKFSEDARRKADEYLTFIGKRASGEISTLARWTRDFVDAHPDYKHESQVPRSTLYDLLTEMDAISKGVKKCPQLLGVAHINGDA